jgi:hypothetical protein
MRYNDVDTHDAIVQENTKMSEAGCLILYQTAVHDLLCRKKLTASGIPSAHTACAPQPLKQSFLSGCAQTASDANNQTSTVLTAFNPFAQYLLILAVSCACFSTRFGTSHTPFAITKPSCKPAPQHRHAADVLCDEQDRRHFERWFRPDGFPDLSVRR